MRRQYKNPTPLWAFLTGMLTAVLIFGVVLAGLGVAYGALRPLLGLLVGLAMLTNATLAVCAVVWYFNPNPYPKGY